MSRRNLAAYTPPGSHYPAFISINRDGDTVEISVRSKVRDDGAEGHQSVIALDLTIARDLLRNALNNLDPVDQ